MTKYIHGWGNCPACGRIVASTAKGRTWRHGRRGAACEGSGRILLNRKKIHKWAGTQIGGV